MHFTWDVSAGQLVVTLPVFWVVIQLVKITNMLMRFRIEHEDLMVDWCARQDPPKKLSELPTRRTRWW